MNLADWVIAGICPCNKMLEEVNATAPWGLIKAELTKFVERKSGGRPSYDLLLLYKMSLLKVWHGLSDEKTEFACCDRLSFKRFLGLGITDKVPDATTLENFRHELEAVGLDEHLLSTLDNFFKQRGLLMQSGTMVDATFVKGNCKPAYDEDLKPAPDAQSDIDAEAGFKGLGYSATTNVDKGTKLIRKVVVGSARAHDSQYLGDVMVGDEVGVVYADSGYEGKEKVLKPELKLETIKKRKRGKKGEGSVELTPEEVKHNKWVGKLRAGVEHVYACWKERFGLKRASYRGLERVNQQMQQLGMAYNLTRWGYLCRQHGYC